MTGKLWTRRHLLQTAGMAAAADPLRLLASAVLPPTPIQPAVATGTHCYAALAASAGNPARLGVFAWTGSAWQSRQVLSAGAPRVVAAGADGQLLYAAHATEGPGGKPAGYVEAFRIDPHTGLLTLQSRCGLALASRMPSGMALSPHGKLLVVAAQGGVFSVVPLDAGGTLQEVTAARKELLSPQQASQRVTMRFVEDDLLLVRSSQTVKRYRCDADGMHPVPADPTADATLEEPVAAPMPHVQSFVLRPPKPSRS